MEKGEVIGIIQHGVRQGNQGVYASATFRDQFRCASGLFAGSCCEARSSAEFVWLEEIQFHLWLTVLETTRGGNNALLPEMEREQVRRHLNQCERI